MVFMKQHEVNGDYGYGEVLEMSCFHTFYIQIINYFNIFTHLFSQKALTVLGPTMTYFK